MHLHRNRNYWLSMVGWCLRTCNSIGIITFLCIYSQTQPIFSFQGKHLNGLAFSIFVAILVKDSTLGASIINAWAIVLGSLTASISCWLMLKLLEGAGSLSVGPSLVVMFGLSFILQYFEFHPLGKKVAISLAAVNMLQDVRAQSRDTIHVWYYMSDVAFGAACGLIGNLLPWRRTACDEIDEIAQFNAVSMSSLFEDIIKEFTNIHINSFPTDKDPLLLESKDLNDDIEIFRKLSSRSTPQYSKYLRNEVSGLLQKNISDMQIMTVEAKLGPKRDHTEIYIKLGSFSRKMMMILSVLEKRLLTIQRLHHHHLETFHELLKYPKLKESLHNLTHSLSIGLYEISQLLKQNIEIFSGELLFTSTTVNAMRNLQQAVRICDEIYKQARHEIYYSPSDPLKSPKFPGVPLILHTNGFLFLLDTACKLVIEFEPRILKRISAEPAASNGRHSSVIAPTCTIDLRQYMNHYLNYFRRLQADIIPPQKHLFPWCCQRQTGPPNPSPSSPSSQPPSPPSGSLAQLSCLHYLHRSWLAFSSGLSPVVLRRLRQCLSVSVSMLIAGIYGYYANITDPSFAAFTVSYISGGAVAGASIVTSFNRCVGSVVACVLALLVIEITKHWSVERGQTFIGFVIVLSQIPATYMRPQRLYGYAGLCFGFTVPILLITYPHIAEETAVQRIIDTIVAVFIFVGSELCILQFESSEDLLLLHLKKIFKGIETHFKIFIDVFRATQLGTQDTSSQLRSLQTQTFLADIRTQRDLISFIAVEPTLWKPPHFPEKLLEELISLEEQAHASIEIMAWAVAASHNFSSSTTTTSPTIWNPNSSPTPNSIADDEEANTQKSFSFVLEPLENHMVDLEMLVMRACTLLHRGIERLQNYSNTPPDKQIPGSSTQRSNHGEKNAKENRKSSSQNSHVLQRLSSTDELYDLSEIIRVAEVIISNSEHIESKNETTLNHNLFEKFESITSSWQDSYKTKSERFISVLASLEEPSSVLSDDSTPEEPGDPSVGKEERENDKPPSSLKKINSNINVRNAQFIASNEEIKIVNAALVSLTDLLGALGGIASVIMKLQAHRAVQTSDDKYFAPFQFKKEVSIPDLNLNSEDLVNKKI